MKVSPKTRYSIPRYPTRSEIDLNPELLRLLPERWRRNALVLAAVTSACTLLTGCRFQGSSRGNHAGTTVPPPPQRVSRVAPLFPNKDDRAHTMGMVATPRFFSEAEARQVILEEAKKEGLIFAEGRTISGITLPIIDKQGKATTRTVDLALDGSEQAHKIGFEFISQSDYTEMNINLSGRKSQAVYSEYGMVADVVRESLETAKPEGTFAVFFDPFVHDPAVAKERLREQVREFVKWLKAEGII